ncbi:hypothetical protein [Pseudochrobactrum sp. MP213Fo]|uniref:hypothetical protein n=1 Tax=Pseudochrobactrum sp. MP213Fo TaxID=3022250 RepID=UPI003BA11ACA
MSHLKPFAFILMPFDKDFDDIYKLGIQAVATENGVVAERVDEQIYSETMLERIYRQIDAADFIIADMSGKNPNVFYEVGYAHAKQKLCTLITRSTDDIPFDLKHHRHIVYDGSIKKLKELLGAELKWLIAENNKSKSSTFTVELKKIDSMLSKTDWMARVEIDIIIDIHNNSDRRSPEIEALYLITRQGWTFSQNGEKCASTDDNTNGKKIKHFLKSPVQRLSPSGWGQIKIKGERMVWSKFSNEEPVKDKYDLKGFMMLHIATSEGTFSEKLNLETTAEEFPF